jgi:hypothetical protein
MDLFFHNLASLYPFGFEVPTSVTGKSLTAVPGNAVSILATNVFFEATFYIVGFEIYMSTAGIFQVAVIN